MIGPNSKIIVWHLCMYRQIVANVRIVTNTPLWFHLYMHLNTFEIKLKHSGKTYKILVVRTLILEGDPKRSCPLPSMCSHCEMLSSSRSPSYEAV